MALTLTDVKYVGPTLVGRLAEMGISNVEQLAAMSVDALAAVSGVGAQTAPLILHNAQALLENPPSAKVKPKKLMTQPVSEVEAPTKAKVKKPKTKKGANAKAKTSDDATLLEVEVLEIDLSPAEAASGLIDPADEEDDVEIEAFDLDDEDEEGLSKKQRKALKKQAKAEKKAAKKQEKAEKKAQKKIEKDAKQQAKALEKAAKKAEKQAKKADNAEKAKKQPKPIQH